jgi:uncharacterized protein (TIGR02996 family)
VADCVVPLRRVHSGYGGASLSPRRGDPVHPERAALLQAIIDHPEDDDRRLVYADWLEEHGDEADAARAEYVRLAITRAGLSKTDDRRREIRERMRALARCHGKRWFSKSSLLEKARLHRGFIHAIRSTAADFNRRAQEMFAVEPVTGMWVVGQTKGFSKFAADPLLSRLRTIKFSQGSLPPTGLAQLAKAGRLTTLEALELWGPSQGHKEIAAFAAGRWPCLRRLRFERCDLDDGDVEVLSRLEAPRLEKLLLWDPPMGPEGVRYLLGAPWFPQLVHLRVVGHSRTRLGQEGVAALCHSWKLANLKRLDLNFNRIGPKGIGLLASSPHLRAIRHLDLSNTNGGAQGFIDLCRSPALRQLRGLAYGGNGVNFSACSSEKVTPWPQLLMLDVAYDRFGDQMVGWLADRGILDRLRELRIDKCQLTALGFLRLLRSPAARSLRQWQNSSNDLSQLDGLPERIDLPRLRMWELDYCALGDEGGARLVRALRAPPLRDLSLYENDLGNATVHAVAHNPSLRRLERLSLSYHLAIDDEGARLLCESPYLDRLTELQLFETGVSEVGLARLRKRFRTVKS